MKYTNFLNRKKELKFLEDLYNSPKPKLLIIYGRRRVGKTTLLQYFGSKYNALYFIGRQESEKSIFRRFSEIFAERFNDPFILKNPFQNWDAIFTYTLILSIFLPSFAFLEQN